MKKSRKLSLEELAQSMNVVDENEQKSLIGGWRMSDIPEYRETHLFTMEEYSELWDNGVWKGGNVEGLGYKEAQTPKTNPEFEKKYHIVSALPRHNLEWLKGQGYVYLEQGNYHAASLFFGEGKHFDSIEEALRAANGGETPLYAKVGFQRHPGRYNSFNDNHDEPMIWKREDSHYKHNGRFSLSEELDEWNVYPNGNTTHFRKKEDTIYITNRNGKKIKIELAPGTVSEFYEAEYNKELRTKMIAFKFKGNKSDTARELLSSIAPHSDVEWAVTEYTENGVCYSILSTTQGKKSDGSSMFFLDILIKRKEEGRDIKIIHHTHFHPDGNRIPSGYTDLRDQKTGSIKEPAKTYGDYSYIFRAECLGATASVLTLNSRGEEVEMPYNSRQTAKDFGLLDSNHMLNDVVITAPSKKLKILRPEDRPLFPNISPRQPWLERHLKNKEEEISENSGVSFF